MSKRADRFLLASLLFRRGDGVRSLGGRYRGWCTASLAIAVLSSGCGTAQRSTDTCNGLERDGSPVATNLVLIVNDTMRRDRIGTYGGPSRTPTLDRFGSDNLVFTRAYTQAPWTKPSMATLFTSLYPSQHGVVTPPQIDGLSRTLPGQPIVPTEVLPAELSTLAEVLRGAGFRTAAFVGNPWLDTRFGFDQGFEAYDDSFASWSASGTQVAQAAARWLASLDRQAPFFLYVHTMESHRPYPDLSRFDILARREEIFADERPVSSEIAEHIAEMVWLEGGLSPVRHGGLKPSLALLEAAYDAGVESFDRVLAELLGALRDHGEYDRTAILVTSDHGEALYGKNHHGHGIALYESEVAVPLLARLPGVVGVDDSVDCEAGLIDVLPTVCDYLDIDCPAGIAGRNLLGQNERRPIVAEGVMHRPGSRMIRSGAYKLILQPDGSIDGTGTLLFDLTEDHHEARNLLDGEIDARSLAAELERAAHGAIPSAPPLRRETVILDAETQQRLEALGYIR